MNLFDEIKALCDKFLAPAEGNTQVLLQETLCVKAHLDAWYSKTADNDRRLIKLIINLIFYLETPETEVPYHAEILSALAVTLLRTADYDLNIAPYPEKVRERNDRALERCDELRKETKQPLEENSSKPYEVTIFMATYNQLELTKLCLESIFRNTADVSYELFLIDNGSSDGTYAYFRDDDRIKFIRLSENTGLLLALHIFYESGLDNGKFWLYMNNDVVVTPQWASNMLKCIKSDPSIGSVLPATNRAAPFACIQPPFGLYDIDDVEAFGSRHNISNPNTWQDWMIYYGFVLLVRPSVRRKFGYYEDCFYFTFYYSDGDIILSQIKAGYRAVQARDTYVHHFDGGHTVLQKRRNLLAEGERQFFKKYGFFPTDIEKDLPIAVEAKARDAAAKNLLFLGWARAHPVMQFQHIKRLTKDNTTKYFAADTMEQLKLEQFGRDVAFKPINNWYEVEQVFPGETFDEIFYSDDIMKLRHPKKFIELLYKRLNINGKLYFLADNSGCLLAMNYIFMSHRSSPRDAMRIRKNSTATTSDIIELLMEVGFSVDSIEDVFYNETFTYANLETIENYRGLYEGDDPVMFERNIRTPVRNIVARKPGRVDTENTLENKLYAKRKV